jgi:hypothetical protein
MFLYTYTLCIFFNKKNAKYLPYFYNTTINLKYFYKKMCSLFTYEQCYILIIFLYKSKKICTTSIIVFY